MDVLDLLVEHRNQIMQGVIDYNKRLDRAVVLYLTALYAAIGLRVTGQIDLSKLNSDPEFTLLSFFFIFLNFCIIIHGLSQSAWAMSLAKFAYLDINDDMRQILEKQKKTLPKSITSFDEWNTDIKHLAVRTRDFVVALWILQVLGVSIYSLRLVAVKQFFLQNPCTTYIFIVFLFILLNIVLYIGLLEIYLTNKFHYPTYEISPPRFLFKILSITVSIIIFILCIFLVIK